MALDVVYVTNRSRSLKTVEAKQIHCKLSDTVDELISHMEYSWDLAFHNSKPRPGQIRPKRTQKLLYREYNEYRGLQNQIRRLDENGEKMTLRAAGVGPKNTLYLLGYTQLKTCYHSIAVHIPSNLGKPHILSIDVVYNTSIGDLKHKIQDKAAILVSEQKLFSNKDPTTALKDDIVAVEIQRRRGFIVLKSTKEHPHIAKWTHRKFKSDIAIIKQGNMHAHVILL